MNTSLLTDMSLNSFSFYFPENIFTDVAIDLAMWRRSSQLIPFFIRPKLPKFS